MIDPELKTFATAVEGLRDPGGLVASIRTACLNGEGHWNIPQDVRRDRAPARNPALVEIELHGIHSSGLSVEEACRNWLKLAKVQIRLEESRSVETSSELAMPVFSYIIAVAERQHRTTTDVLAELITDLARVPYSFAPDETELLLNNIRREVTGGGPDWRKEIAADIERKSSLVASVAA